MRIVIVRHTLAAVLASGALASAQQPATTVQLPTFSQFTVRTTVSVPDGGTAFVGGIDRGFESTTTRGLGPLGSRSTSGGRSTSGATVSATIIDHTELDRAVLAAAAAGRSSTDSTAAKAQEIKAALPVNNVAAKSRGASRDHLALPGSVAAIRHSQHADDQQRAAEIAGDWQRAREAEAAGKLAVAKVYYQLVARSGQKDLQQQAAARLAALSKSSPGTSSVKK